MYFGVQLMKGNISGCYMSIVLYSNRQFNDFLPNHRILLLGVYGLFDLFPHLIKNHTFENIFKNFCRMVCCITITVHLRKLN